MADSLPSPQTMPLACPFCGSEPIVEDHGAIAGGWHVRCICYLAPGVCDHRREDAIGFWNRRAESLRDLPPEAKEFRMEIDAERSTKEEQHIDEVAGVGDFHVEVLDENVLCAHFNGRAFTIWARKGKLYFRYDWADEDAPVIEKAKPSAPPGAGAADTEHWSGSWNNWIAPFHACPRCRASLDWKQGEDMLDRPWISARCCGLTFSAPLARMDQRDAVLDELQAMLGVESDYRAAALPGPIPAAYAHLAEVANRSCGCPSTGGCVGHPVTQEKP